MIITKGNEMKKLLLVSLVGLFSASFASVASSPMDSMLDIAKKGVEEVSKGVAQGVDVAHDNVAAATESLAKAPHHLKKSLFEVGLIEEIVDETPYFKWSQEKLDHLAKGDVKRGEALAKDKALKCYKCHGKNGISDEDDSPSIAGQIAAYTYKQLHDYREKLRDDKTMYKKVKDLTEQQMIDLSVFYAGQKAETQAKAKAIPHLAQKGDKSRFLLACESCHDPKAMKRGFQTPIITGQKPEYFLDTMNMFKEAERTNDHYSVMGKIVSRMTDEEIESLSTYYATKPAEE